jgi:predicted amidohydrolase YtcJ
MAGGARLVVGRIATLAGGDGPGWVEAIALDGGRVVAAGSLADVEAAVGAFAGRLRLAPDEVAIPGLTDAHLHLAEASLARRRAQLEGAASIGDLVARVRAAAPAGAGAGSWIEGAGWDADTLGCWPTADDLEAAAPGRRIAVWAHDHHALLASRAALAEAGVDAATPDPDGGVIRRDADGGATGVLHEAAARLVASLVPRPTMADVAEALVPATRELLGLGVVAVHDPGGLAERADLGGPIAAYLALAARSELLLRVHPCVRPEQLEAAGVAGFRSGGPMGPDPLGRLRLGWLKTFADGSLGSRTAALLEPLVRQPSEPEPPNGGLGVWLAPPDELARQASRAAALGITTQVHAIGDAAVRAALDVLAPTVGRTALVPRVEHAQLVASADIPRFGATGIAASMQPIHVRSDAVKARRLWGDRADAYAYAFAALDRAGALIVFGTDAPVEPVDPWPGLACAVTRASPEWPAGTAPFGPQNALDLWQAIRAACLNPALSAAERDRGRLLPGHRADLVVIPAAAVSDPVETGGALWNARPRLVLLDGEVAAER